MIAKKRKKLIITISIVIPIIIILGVLIVLYFTTDLFKSNNRLFMNYISQNFSIIDKMTAKEPTGIKDAIENQKLTTNMKTTISYTDSENNTGNSINKAELNISSQIDKKEQYDYKNVRLTFENEDIGKVEYLKLGDKYGIRLDGIKQFVSAKNENLDELELKTGISKKDLEKVTYMFNPLSLSDFISFTPSELEVMSSSYTSLIQQNTNSKQYIKKSNQNIVVNGNTYKANAYSLKLTKEEFNNLFIKILERLQNEEILLAKLDTLQQQLEKYNAYKQEEGKSLRQVVIELLDTKIQDITQNNIGQEETEITVYEYKGNAIKTLIKTPNENITIDALNNENLQISYIQNFDNKTKEQNIIIERKVSENGQNTVVQYIQSTDETEEKNFSFNIIQNKEDNKIDNSYTIQYTSEGNKATIKSNQYINIVNGFENTVEFTQDNNMDLDSLEQAQAQIIINILDDNVNGKIKNIIDKIKLDDINTMLKDLGIIKESEIKFEDKQEEIVTEAERVRFNSQLTFFIGKEVDANTIKQMLDTVKDSFVDAQIVFEKQKNSNKEQFKGMILDIKRQNSNPQKIEEITKALDENKSEKYTVAMAFDENTKLINKITVVSNKFLQ